LDKKEAGPFGLYLHFADDNLIADNTTNSYVYGNGSEGLNTAISLPDTERSDGIDYDEPGEFM